MKDEMNVIMDMIYNNKENFKDNDYIIMMNTLMKIYKVLPKYSYNKKDELSIISYRIYKLENEVRILKNLKEEILRERIIPI